MASERDNYSEKVLCKVEINLSDFRQKLALADAELDEFAAGPDVQREGSNTSFGDAGDAMIDAALGAMEDFVREVMAESLVQVPKDTLVLQQSARPLPLKDDPETLPRQDGNRIVVEFGYGFGDDINPKTGRRADQYALPVHEIVEAEHAAPTKSHYLIDPLIEKASEYGPELTAAMRGADLTGYKVNKGVFLFRKGGGPGVHAVFNPQGRIAKRKRA